MSNANGIHSTHAEHATYEKRENLQNREVKWSDLAAAPHFTIDIIS